MHSHTHAHTLTPGLLKAGASAEESPPNPAQTLWSPQDPAQTKSQLTQEAALNPNDPQTSRNFPDSSVMRHICRPQGAPHHDPCSNVLPQQPSLAFSDRPLHPHCPVPWGETGHRNLLPDPGMCHLVSAASRAGVTQITPPGAMEQRCQLRTQR